LGFGAQQAAAGFELFGLGVGSGYQCTDGDYCGVVDRIGAVYLCCGGCVVGRRVKVLSNIKHGPCGYLACSFIIFAGSDMSILETLWITTTSYATNVVAFK